MQMLTVTGATCCFRIETSFSQGRGIVSLVFRFIFCPQVLKTTPIVKTNFHFPLFVADYYPSQGSQVLMAAYKPDIPFQDS